MRGESKGQFRYAVKHLLSEFRLESDLNAREAHKVEVANLGGNDCTVNVGSAREKTMKIESSGKIGVGKDHIRVGLAGVPVDATRPVAMNLRPGLGGLDLLAGPGGGNVTVSISAVVDGRPVNRSFRLPVSGGVRLKPAQALAEGTLMISEIDNLFGPARGARSIRAQ